MRKRFRVLVLAAIIAAIGVPLGFALSREADAVAVTPAPHIQGAAVVASAIAVAPGVIASDRAVSVPVLPSLPDGAKLLFVGTVLVGVAAAMRRAV
jgi:hypothetical protein